MDGADGSSNFRDGHDLGKEEKVICVRTESAENIIDDGYEWKKYGQKRIRDRIHPRYFLSSALSITSWTSRGVAYILPVCSF